MSCAVKTIGVVMLFATGLMAASPVPARASDEVLKICLNEDLPPLSMHRRGAPDSGFDVALAQALAHARGRSDG